MLGCTRSNVRLKEKKKKSELKVCVCGPSDLTALVFCLFFLPTPPFCLQGYTCLSHDFIQTGAISNGSITSVIVSSTLQQRLDRRRFDKINVRALSGICCRPEPDALRTRCLRSASSGWREQRGWEREREGEEWSEREIDRARERKTWSSKGVSKRSDKDTNAHERVLLEKLSKNGRKPFFSSVHGPR